MSKVKAFGEVFTPDYLVNNMLDLISYNNEEILKKHIIDNSCGDGAFLKIIVERYCLKYIEKFNNIIGLKEELEDFIHGIEIDNLNYKKCIENLNLVSNKFGLFNVNWSILNSNTLEIENFNNKMDFVIGNPPYVRIHNLKKEYFKKYEFANYGMTDLYIIFFEIGFNMLNKNGKMCLITPSSFLSSIAGRGLRNYILKNQNLVKYIDLEEYQPFKGIATFTCISVFNNNFNEKIKYYNYDKELKTPCFVENICFNKINKNDRFLIAKNEILNIYDKIDQVKINSDIEVKNGLATLADDVFIGNFNFNDNLILKALKSSTGVFNNIIFPYDKNGNPIEESFLKENHFQVYNYLIKNKEKLLNRSIKNKKEWYLFGRSQALKDINKNKISINILIKDLKSIKLINVKENEAVYGGLYILSSKYSYDDIYKVIYSTNFINYIHSLKKYKSGGYFTFTSKELLKYLIYSL